MRVFLYSSGKKNPPEIFRDTAQLIEALEGDLMAMTDELDLTEGDIVTVCVNGDVTLKIEVGDMNEEEISGLPNINHGRNLEPTKNRFESEE